MSITQQQINALEAKINTKLSKFNAQFVMTVHFSVDRLNDARNNPPITLEELESIFDSLVDNHITSIVALNDKDTFNIRCSKSHINMPCGVVKESQNNGSVTHKNIVITIMRKETFKAKDPIEFIV
ncbi:TPA: hypothetical protein NG570_004550 [Vibrio parahaemolyticus]|nr:hypothetical protein [Vibrio parahaemolyticus]EJA3100736.1 hypothetical protein [Vibrio parahaemolyticus]MBE5132539.1 hypothetical protein [Vibrio parahaemolyticus]HAV1374322.1 hypothetical protein [Vibrio parahaemolyticus]HCE2196582.1 hypothetical protein [Vibrio parahaemolyticus]